VAKKELKLKIFQTGNKKSLLIIFEFEAAVVSVVGIVLLGLKDDREDL